MSLSAHWGNPFQTLWVWAYEKSKVPEHMVLGLRPFLLTTRSSCCPSNTADTLLSWGLSSVISSLRDAFPLIPLANPPPYLRLGETSHTSSTRTTLWTPTVCLFPQQTPFPLFLIQVHFFLIWNLPISMCHIIWFKVSSLVNPIPQRGTPWGQESLLCSQVCPKCPEQWLP